MTHHHTLLFACGAAALSALVLLRSSGLDNHYTGPEAGVPASYFGFHAHHLDGDTPWPTAGFGAYRAWDARVRWADLQPAPDRWQWQTLDALVDGASNRKIEFLLPLGMPPRWASRWPDEHSAYGRGEAAVPRDMALWDAYVETVASRYRGRIQAYEIWNEPNLPSFFSGSPAQAVELSCRAREVLRRVDPAARLVSPSATEAKGVSWLADFLNAGGGKCVDIIGYHFYHGHRDPEHHLPLIADVKEVMQRWGAGDKPLWNTETGWLIADPGGQADARAAGFKKGDRTLHGPMASGVVARALLLHWLAGDERFYWYALDNSAMGLLDYQRQPRAVYLAYQQVATLLTGRQLQGCEEQGGEVWRCEISQAGRPIASVVWSTAADNHVSPPAGSRAQSRFGQPGLQPPATAPVELDGVPWVFWREPPPEGVW